MSEELAEIVARNNRLLEGENGLTGLVDRVARLEAAVDEIADAITAAKTAGKTIALVVALIGIANVAVLVTILARAAGVKA